MADKMKAAIYTRVSTPGQVQEGESFTIVGRVVYAMKKFF